MRANSIGVKSAICILGMHRSGTSCLAGSLEQFGLHLGNVNNDAPHNRKGNKENSSTWLINDQVLELSGGKWDAPPPHIQWNGETKILRDNFLASFANEKIWGFKDPRSVLTLPFWLEAIPDFKLVGSFRNPSSVAKSLARRNGFSLEKSLALWAHYNKLLLSYSELYGMRLINFDLEQHKYFEDLQIIACSTGLANEIDKGARPFFENKLRQQVASIEEINQLPTEYLKLYKQLCELSHHSLSN